MTPRLKEIFKKEIQPALKDTTGIKKYLYGPKNRKSYFKYGPRIGWSRLRKYLKSCEEDMAKISGQHPVITKV